MEKKLHYTLIADGSSDKTLLGIIKWVLDDLYPTLPNDGKFADFRNMKKPPKIGDVAAQISTAQMYYPCDIVIYHRDGERRDKDIVVQRKSEILQQSQKEKSIIVCIVPVVVMETWLLIDEVAIKKAAGNPNYSGKITLPPPKSLEAESDPKQLLHSLLREASGLKGRNRDRFNASRAVHLVAEYIQDFSPLRKLEAFQTFETDLKEAVKIFMA